MNIATKDIILDIYSKFRFFIHRLIFKKRFIPPHLLYGLNVECIREISLHEQELPKEFAELSHCYQVNHSANFTHESVYCYTVPTDTEVHEARFIQIGENSFLNVGDQGHQRWRKLEKPFESRATVVCDTLIVPWGIGDASYGDFLIQLLPKLARILASIPYSDRPQTSICLPFFHQRTWAVEYLELLDITKEQIQDGSRTIVVPAGGKIIVGSGPSSGHGICHPQDIQSLLQQINLNLPTAPTSAWRKLYISRKIGRRMANEDSLLDGLQTRGFEIIHLEELSLSRQIQLFQEASVIVGPHGAGHANIMWSAPGTHLLEVFHPSWMHPSYAFLAKIKHIHHHCLSGYSGSTRGSWTKKSHFGIFEDPEIDPVIFFKKIDSILHL